MLRAPSNGMESFFNDSHSHRLNLHCFRQHHCVALELEWFNSVLTGITDDVGFSSQFFSHCVIICRRWDSSKEIVYLVGLHDITVTAENVQSELSGTTRRRTRSIAIDLCWWCPRFAFKESQMEGILYNQLLLSSRYITQYFCNI